MLGIACIALLGFFLIAMPWLPDWNPQAPFWRVEGITWEQAIHMTPTNKLLLSLTATVKTLAWLAPLVAPGGHMVLLKGERAAQEVAAAQGWLRRHHWHAEVRIVGLLRRSEAAGRFPRGNDPAADRWYNRTIEQIAERRGLGHVAPYFVDVQRTDADADDAGAGVGVGAGLADGRAATATARAPGREPVPGLTVVSFRDHHLGYALTWFALALMTAGATLRVWRWHCSAVAADAASTGAWRKGDRG